MLNNDFSSSNKRGDNLLVGQHVYCLNIFHSKIYPQVPTVIHVVVLNIPLQHTVRETSNNRVLINSLPKLNLTKRYHFLL